MANRWGNNETVRDFILRGSKITAVGDCSNLDSILKSILKPTKVKLVKAMVFPVVMYRFESWTTKKAEH